MKIFYLFFIYNSSALMLSPTLVKSIIQPRSLEEAQKNLTDFISILKESINEYQKKE